MACALPLALAAGACSSSSQSGSQDTTSDSGATSSGEGGSSSSSGSGSSSGSTSGSSSGSWSSSGSDAMVATDTGAGDGGLFDPAEIARVGGWLSTTTSGLEGYAYTNINMYFPVGPKRDRLVDSIVGACAAFAPRLPGWQVYCEALETSEIVSESSYNPGSVNGTTDPTVGLLQVRFSSTVQDYNFYGPLPTIQALGCSWPASLAGQTQGSSFWNTAGSMTANLAFMEDPACNIPLSAWYVWMNATGNGGPSAIYAAGYCGGKGVAGNVVEGLLSFLDGPAYPRPANANDSYVTGIKTRFGKLLGGLPNPDPFGVTLSPNVSEYCK